MLTILIGLIISIFLLEVNCLRKLNLGRLKRNAIREKKIFKKNFLIVYAIYV